MYPRTQSACCVQCIPKPSQPVVYHMLYLVQFNVCLNPVFLYSTSSHLILGPPVQHRHFDQSFALVWYGYFTTLDQSYSKAKINYYVCHLKEGRGRIDMKQKRQGRRRKECAWNVESKAAQVQVQENTAKLLVKTVSWMNVRVGIASMLIFLVIKDGKSTTKRSKATGILPCNNTR